MNSSSIKYGALILLLIGMAGCSGTGPSAITSTSQPYDWESEALHPLTKLFHTSDEISELHYSINTSELLYARMSPEEPFRSNVLISAFIYSGNRLIDSLSQVIVDTNQTKKAKQLTGSLNFPLNDSLSGTIRFKLEDRLKGLFVVKDIPFDKSSVDDEHNFLLRDHGNNNVILGNSVSSGELIDIEYRDRARTQFYLRNYFDSNDLPPPPFYYSYPNPLEKLKLLEERGISASNSKLTVFCEKGYLLISTDDSSTQGIGLQVRHEDYPRITRLEEMILSLRYITSKSEYEDIALSVDAKQKMDDFWMDCGGSAEKARDLIKFYYTCVEEANNYFGCQIEGWKSDRGLIHIVYGNPSKVISKSNSETWIYGEENNINTLSFTFKKMENSISSNHYVLMRDPIYKSSWSRAVDSWRNGRIYND